MKKLLWFLVPVVILTSWGLYVSAQPNQGGGPFPNSFSAIALITNGTPTGIFVDTKGNIRIGTNWSFVTMSGTNGILIGSFNTINAPWIAGNGICIGGANGGGADNEAVAIGQGAGAADGTATNFATSSSGAIALGNQTDAFGKKSITIGYGNAGMFSDYTIMIGTGNQSLIADNSKTNCIYIGNSMGSLGLDNATVIGNSISSTTLIFGKITGNGNGLTNINTTNLTWTIVNTNFVQGFIYTNFYGAPIEVNANIRVTTAAVAGDSDMDLQQPAGTLAARIGLQSVAAQTNECHLIWKIPINGTYAISNTLTTGSGNAVIVIGGQIFVY